MANLQLQLGTDADIVLLLGDSFLSFNVGVTQVTQNIVIEAERPFLYYNPRFLTALNNGTITQVVYNAIIDNQDTMRQTYTIETNLQIEKQLLIDLVLQNNIPNVDTGGGTAAEIVEDVQNEGYLFIKKI
jgi:hypothetical protein